MLGSIYAVTLGKWAEKTGKHSKGKPSHLDTGKMHVGVSFEVMDPKEYKPPNWEAGQQGVTLHFSSRPASSAVSKTVFFYFPY